MQRKFTRFNKILSAILAAVLFLGAMPLPAFSVDSEQTIPEAASVTAPRITLDGVTTDFMELRPHEKVDIQALSEGEITQYQWQILHPEKEDLWINIGNANAQSISVTLALVGNMLNHENVAQLRCRMTVDGEQRHTSAITVQYIEEDTSITVVQETEPVTEATEPVEETEPDTEATEPAEETEPDTEATEPAEETEPVTEATEPVEETEPATEATEPVEETEPATEATEPAEETEPTTEATEEPAEETEPAAEATEPAATTAVEEILTAEVAVAPKNAAVPLAEGEDDATEPTEGTDSTTPEYVVVKVEYIRYDYELNEANHLVLVNNGTAFTSYIATLHYGSELKNTTVSFPTMVGYDTVLVNEDKTETKCTSLTFDLDSVTSNITYTVKYLPAEVNYTIRYYLQNIYDDLYVEDSASMKQLQGETGTVPDAEAINKKFDGFTSLYYQPDFIAADGSTVFEVYYERNYYLMEFDCNGGYGADTVYVRYGTYISIPNPVKSGWTFDGWDLMSAEDDQGNILTLKQGTNNELIPYEDTADDDIIPVPYADGVANPLPATMPYYNSAYRALWTHADTTFTVTYWVENADDDGYSYVARVEKVPGITGETVTQDNIESKYNINIEIPTPAAIDEDVRRHIELNTEKTTAVTLEGNGSTSFNIYYDRKDYSLKFYYAMSSGIGNNTQYYVIGGSTYGFGTNSDSSARNDEIELLDQYMASNGWSGQRGNAVSKPTLNSLGNARNYIEASDTSTIGNTTYTYYYIAFTEKYGADISGLWPCGVFSPVEMETGNTSWSESSNAIVSAWNGEYRVEYNHNSVNNGNQTVKGNYEKLDEYLLWRYSFTNAYADTTDNDINKDGFNDDTAGTVAFLCFWENGDDNGWSIPELYIYNIWLECIEDHEHPSEEWKYENGKWYYLEKTYYTCDDSSIKTQTTPALSGFKPAGTNWSAIFIGSQNADGIHYSGNDVFYNTETQRVWHSDWGTNPAPLTALWTNGAYLLYDETPYPEDQYNRYTYDPKDPGEIISHELYREAYSREFFFDRLSYTIHLENYATTHYEKTLYVGTKLSSLENMTEPDKLDWDAWPTYPSVLEPNAYEFAGWYTAPNGAGMKIVIDSTKQTDQKDFTNNIWYNPTMPDDNLLLFAYWKPVVHDVYFYYLYDHIKANTPWTEPTNEDGNRLTDKDGNPVTITYPIKASHGTLLGTAYNYKPKRDGYTFIGWFYMDAENKKRFAPDSMEITQDLKLFAEWQSGIDTTYEVKYVLKEAYTTTGDNPVTYPAGYEIAQKSAGHITAGKTKSFQAKGKTDLEPAFRTGFFPEVNSHSILMDEDSEKNTYRFEYLHDDEVLYQVRYVNSVTGVVMEPPEVKRTSDAIVTEKFKPFVGLIPQSYYVRKTLAYDGDAEKPIEANIITFYYTPDTQHGLYSIEYYLENADSNDYLNPANYTQSEYTVGSGDTSSTVTATVRTYEGYTHVPALNTVITYNENGTEKEVKMGVGENDTPPAPYGTVAYTGLTIKIYYQRNSYPYKILYINADAEEGNNILTPLNAPLKDIVGIEMSDKYDKDFTHTAATSFKARDGKTYEYYLANATPEQRTQTRTIKASNNVADNTMRFYYKQKTVTVIYHAVCSASNAKDFGYVSPNAEWGTKAGSTATALEGFRFVGWYKDEACTTAVETSWVSGGKLTPKELIEDEDWTNHYYARFEPVQEDLKITKQAAEGTNLGSDTFLFKVTGKNVFDQNVELIVSIQGQGSVTIKDLYCGDYTVTELTDWSWTYTCTSAENQTATLTTKDTDTEYEVIFTNKTKSVDWLNGESTAEENQFN